MPGGDLAVSTRCPSQTRLADRRDDSRGREDGVIIGNLQVFRVLMSRLGGGSSKNGGGARGVGAGMGTSGWARRSREVREEGLGGDAAGEQMRDRG